MKLIFIGPQGSGKGTQGKIVSKKLGLAHISTGDLIRETKGELRKEINSYINKGKLVPDSLILEILKQRIKKEDCSRGFILDGFPRNLEQAKELEKLIKINAVIEINISDKEAIKRVSGRYSCESCGKGYNYVIPSLKPRQKGICDECEGKLVQRQDDYPKAIQKRLEIYHQKTKPLLNYYKSIEDVKVLKINGEQDIKKVSEDILIKLKNIK